MKAVGLPQLAQAGVDGGLLAPVPAAEFEMLVVRGSSDGAAAAEGVAKEDTVAAGGATVGDAGAITGRAGSESWAGPVVAPTVEVDADADFGA